MGLFEVSLLTLLVLFAGTIELSIRMGKLKRPTQHSYVAVLFEGFRWGILAAIVSLGLYVFSRSLEASLTLGIFL